MNPAPAPAQALARATEIRDLWPDLHWPYSPEGTQRLVRLGRLAAVKVGRNVFFTRQLLEQFVSAHTTSAQPTSTVVQP